jgi:hypothetical protein
MLLFCACLDLPTGKTPDDPLVADFTTVWAEFEKSYPEFEMKGIDWRGCYYRHLPAAVQAETVDELMMQAVLPMLAELEDVHVWLQSPESGLIRTWDPPIDANYYMPLLMNTYLLPNGFLPWERGVGYCPPDQLPYLSIDTWIADLNMERIDEFVEMAQGCPSIIVDVRMNSGGNNLLCQEAAGRFAAYETVGWMSRTRTGPGYGDCAYYDVITSPAGPSQYTGTVYLLTGEYCASSTEDFICSMRELPNVVVLGDTTLGAGCCPGWIELPNRWSFTSISWSTRTAWDVPVEWLGLPPDIPVAASSDDFAAGVDPVLEHAIGLVRGDGAGRGSELHESGGAGL